MSCRKMPKRNICDDKQVTIPNEYMPCEDLRVCLGLGRSLYFDGMCWAEDNPMTVADGVYNSFTVKDGCIVAAEKQPAPVYTPNPCASVPQPCTGGGDGGSGMVVDTASPCNMFYQGANGYGAWLVAQSSDTVQFSGCGTQQQPLTASVQLPDNTTKLISGTPNQITVTEQEAGWLISHQPGLQSTISGMTFDEAGHLIRYTEPAATGLTGVAPGPGIDVQREGSVAIITLAETEAKPGKNMLGGFEVQTDLYGRVMTMEQKIALNNTDGYVLFDPYKTMIHVNTLGSIDGLTSIDRRPTWNFSKLFSPGRPSTIMTFTTEINGGFRIEYTGDLGAGTASTTGLQGLPTGYQLLVDGMTVNAYIVVADNRIVRMVAVNAAIYGPGGHTVQVVAPTFADMGLLDVSLMVAGS